MGNLHTVSEWKGVIVDGIEAVGVHKGVMQNCSYPHDCWSYC